MVESASLLRRYKGNCIEGSNPSLSAIFEKNMNANEMIKYCIQLYFDGCDESDPEKIIMTIFRFVSFCRLLN